MTQTKVTEIMKLVYAYGNIREDVGYRIGKGSAVYRNGAVQSEKLLNQIRKELKGEN